MTVYSTWSELTVTVHTHGGNTAESSNDRAASRLPVSMLAPRPETFFINPKESTLKFRHDTSCKNESIKAQIDLRETGGNAATQTSHS